MNYNFCVIGSSTPLQKALPLILSHNNAGIGLVFLDTASDQPCIDFCQTHQIPFYDLKILKTPEGVGLVQDSAPDYLFNINSTLILSEALLKSPKTGAINFHPGKLPEYAGLHTHQWAIRNGEKTFGVTLHHMEPGIDTGKIALQRIFPIEDTDTGLSLFLKCLKEGEHLIKVAVNMICTGSRLPALEQDLSHRKLYTKSMALNGEIDWQKSSLEIHNFIRASDYTPFKSPTYQAFFIYKKQIFYCSKSELTDHLHVSPGEFRYREEGLLAGTSDEPLLLKKLKDKTGKIISPEALAEIFHS